VYHVLSGSSGLIIDSPDKTVFAPMLLQLFVLNVTVYFLIHCAYRLIFAHCSQAKLELISALSKYTTSELPSLKLHHVNTYHVYTNLFHVNV
jgi:hypothetical protein